MKQSSTECAEQDKLNDWTDSLYCTLFSYSSFNPWLIMLLLRNVHEV